MSSERVITIKLEIEIPVGAEVALPSVKTTTLRRGGEEVLGHVVSHVIAKPSGSVPCRWDGTTGWVCASGTAFEGGESADRVKLKVYPGFYSGGLTPDLTATTVSNLNSLGEWGDIEISGVTGHPSSLNHTFVCWGEWPDGTVRRTSNVFQPIWGAYTECNAAVMRLRSPVGPGSQVFELLPVAWRVRLRGFFGTPLSRLNGEWMLRLVSPSCFPIVFCSGGDGVKQPRIQLRWDSVVSAVWELVLETGGCRVTYTCPGKQFDNQGRNVFQNACAVGIGEDVGIPAMISVVPA